MQPWYWWSYPILDMHWYWNQQRSLLRDNWSVSFFLRLLGILLFVCGNMLMVKKLIYSRKNTPLMCSLINAFKQFVFAGLSSL